MKQLESQELETLQSLNQSFAEAKAKISDYEYAKFEAIQRVSSIKQEFAAFEKQLIEKYGDNVSINIKTGDITENVEDK